MSRIIGQCTSADLRWAVDMVKRKPDATKLADLEAQITPSRKLTALLMHDLLKRGVEWRDLDMLPDELASVLFREDGTFILRFRPTVTPEGQETFYLKLKGTPPQNAPALPHPQI